MVDEQMVEAFLTKARESLETAESEYSNHRYNSCANRCYYACFQAAVAALVGEGIGPRQEAGRWRHEYVQAAFIGYLINRRKLYPGHLGDTLNLNRDPRETADYRPFPVTQKQAERALRRSREFVHTVHQHREERS